MQGADAYIAGSAAGPSAVVRLPAGANWVDPAAWQHLPDLNGEQPEIAPGPLGPVALLEPPPFSKREELFTQRWTGLRWTAPGDVGGVSYDSSFALAGSGTRLTGIWAVDPPGFPYLLDMVTSTDGGTLWSSEATLAVSPTALYTLELATNPAGRGVAVNGGDTNARPIWVYVIDPRKAERRPRALRRHHRAGAHRPGRLRQRAAGAPARAGRARGRPREPERRAAQRPRLGVALADPAPVALVDAGRPAPRRAPSARHGCAWCRATGGRGRCASTVRGCGRIA